MNSHKALSALVILTAALVAICAGCGPAPDATVAPQPTDGEIIVRPAAIEGVEILILESFPVQVHVVIRGNLPDGCSKLRPPEPVRVDNTFKVEVLTERPADAVCTTAVVPFEETVPLDVYGLPAGTYTVDVNGKTAEFTLQVDNVAPTP